MDRVKPGEIGRRELERVGELKVVRIVGLRHDIDAGDAKAGPRVSLACTTGPAKEVE
jgi:hypothetical protein